MTEEIIWKDPPKVTRNHTQGSWKDRLEPIMARPRAWALVHIAPTKATAYSTVAHLKAGILKPPDGHWEFRAVSEEGKGSIYARYLGPTDEAPE